MTVYLILDASYYCFYRYHALKQWWKLARPDKTIEEHLEEFLSHYHHHFITKLQEMPKKLGIEGATFIVGKDCPRKDIWRTKLYPDYKANRQYNDQPLIRTSFAKIYAENWFQEGGAEQILYHPNLEADDVIALYAQQLPSDADIHIVTSDTDYIQLLSRPNITIHTLKGALLSETKGYDGNPEKYLFCKCLTGDKSDHIPSAFPKCGPKTAEKCWNDPDFFQQKMENPQVKQQFELNQTLISFKNIPKEYTLPDQSA